MKSIEICIKDAVSFAEKQYEANKASATEAIAKLHDGNGEGNDFLGWLNLPSSIPSDLLDRINKTAERLRENCEYVVCVGIGGSYLSAKAVISALSDSFADFYAPKPNSPKVFLRRTEYRRGIYRRTRKTSHRKEIRHHRNLKVRHNHRTGHRFPHL